MKRSEMIKLLDSKFVFPEGLASEILDVLEHAGMLPPFSHDIFHKNWRAHRDINLAVGNEWEPEHTNDEAGHET